MHDVPNDLMAQIKDLESQFTIDTTKMHEIVARFQSELEKGALPIPRSARTGALTFIAA
jgi:hexokinase